MSFDTNNLESDQAYSTNKNQYPGGSLCGNTVQEEKRLEMINTVRKQYYCSFFNITKTNMMYQLLKKALETFIETADWEDLEDEYENIIY